MNNGRLSLRRHASQLLTDPAHLFAQLEDVDAPSLSMKLLDADGELILTKAAYEPPQVA